MWKQNIIVILLFARETITAKSGTECVTPNGEAAVCKSVYDCQSIKQFFVTRNEIQKKFWQESQCGYEKYPLVCCGTLGNYICGIQDTKVNMTDNTEMNALPWIARLEYRNEEYSCNGALISSRYIITSAVCVRSSTRGKAIQLEKVHLGWSTNERSSDCTSVENQTRCTPDREEIDIESITVSGQYDPYDNSENNIALIKLAKDVKYTNNIRPICLPRKNESFKVGSDLYLFRGDLLIPTGTYKMRMANLSTCASGSFSPSEKFICAEDTDPSRAGYDGGPVMTTSTSSNITRWYLVGLATPFAAVAVISDREVFTNISSFLNWIDSNVVSSKKLNI